MTGSGANPRCWPPLFFFVSRCIRPFRPRLPCSSCPLGGRAGVGMAWCWRCISRVRAARHRGRLGALYQLSIVIGILLAYLSNWLILRLDKTTRWRSAARVRHKIFVAECWRAMFGAEMGPWSFFRTVVVHAAARAACAGKEAQGLALLTRVSGRLLPSERLRFKRPRAGGRVRAGTVPSWPRLAGGRDAPARPALRGEHRGVLRPKFWPRRLRGRRRVVG